MSGLEKSCMISSVFSSSGIFGFFDVSKFETLFGSLDKGLRPFYLEENNKYVLHMEEDLLNRANKKVKFDSSSLLPLAKNLQNVDVDG